MTNILKSIDTEFIKFINILTLKFDWKSEVNKKFKLTNTFIKYFLILTITNIISYIFIKLQRPESKYVLELFIFSYFMCVLMMIFNNYFIDKITALKQSKFKQLLNFNLELSSAIIIFGIIINILQIIVFLIFGKINVFVDIIFSIIGTGIFVISFLSLIKIVENIYGVKDTRAIRNIIYAFLIVFAIFIIISLIFFTIWSIVYISTHPELLKL
ncbi:MAG: hypothetical protein V1824_02615 [archaeon]